MDVIRNYLPSRSLMKKVGAVVLFLLVLIGIRALYIHATVVKKTTVSGAPFATPIVISDLAALENQNGTPDWMTNIRQLIDVPGTVNPADAGSQGNETTQFAQDLFSAAATISEAGPVSSGGAQSIADTVVNQLATDKNGDIITVADIKTSTATDTKTIINYSNSIDTLIKKYPLSADSFSILENALSSNDPTQLAKLKPITDNYDAFSTALSKLTVPMMFIQSHLELANSIAHLSAATKSFGQVFDNPILTMSYMYQIQNYLGSYQEAVTIHGQVLNQYASHYK